MFSQLMSNNHQHTLNAASLGHVYVSVTAQDFFVKEFVQAQII